MPQSAPLCISKDECSAILRCMVEEIGSSPQQDPHFDYWHYAKQEELWGLEQSYAQAVIRKYVELRGGSDPSPALCGPMDLFMAACQQA